MTPVEIFLTIVAVILVVVIVRMVQVWPRPKIQPKIFGLPEAERFLDRVPEITPEEIKKLILPWTIDVLGYVNAVGENADAEITTIKGANHVNEEEIKDNEATIAQLQRENADKQNRIETNNKRIARVIDISKTFES